MADFMVGIFRVTDPLDNSKQSIVQERYIALYFNGNVPAWETSETLFGLQEKLKDVVKVIKWEDAERQLLSVGCYKVVNPTKYVNEEEGRFRSAGIKDGWMA